jgi:hypothetical protein
MDEKPANEGASFGKLLSNFIRWLLFLPVGLLAGSFVVSLLGMMFLGMTFLPHVRELSLSNTIILEISAGIVFGFIATIYGVRIAPSVEKRIPGLIITFVLFGISSLVGGTGRFLSIFLFSAALTSAITAFRFFKSVVFADSALTLCRRAAEQGGAEAQYNLGVMYAKGRGVEQNEAEALQWIRKAADQGNEPAKQALERLQQQPMNPVFAP